MFERWEVTTDSGEIRSFGGGVSTTSNQFNQSAGNSIGWSVKWGGLSGNCTGPSCAIDGQAQYASRWSLASRSDRWGSTVSYGYNEFTRDADGLLGCNAEQLVGGQGGLPYTKAIYLTSITDIFGRQILFTYANKSYTTAAQEYMDAHTVLEVASTPGTAPTNLGTPNAYQDCYETLFLSALAVCDAAGDTLYSLNLTYVDPVAVSTLSGSLAIQSVKRYLSAITEDQWFLADAALLRVRIQHQSDPKPEPRRPDPSDLPARRTGQLDLHHLGALRLRPDDVGHGPQHGRHQRGAASVFRRGLCGFDLDQSRPDHSHAGCLHLGRSLDSLEPGRNDLRE